MDNNQKMIVYITEDSFVKIETIFNDETVWISLGQMLSLFQRDKSTIARHIKNIYKEGKLIREAIVVNFTTVQNEGDRQAERNLSIYNLGIIISVGYRVKSKREVQIRI